VKSQIYALFAQARRAQKFNEYGRKLFALVVLTVTLEV